MSKVFEIDNESVEFVKDIELLNSTIGQTKALIKIIVQKMTAMQECQCYNEFLSIDQKNKFLAIYAILTEADTAINQQV